jgi:hypothetical protein
MTDAEEAAYWRQQVAVAITREHDRCARLVIAEDMLVAFWQLHPGELTEAAIRAAFRDAHEGLQ